MLVFLATWPLFTYLVLAPWLNRRIKHIPLFDDSPDEMYARWRGDETHLQQQDLDEETL